MYKRFFTSATFIISLLLVISQLVFWTHSQDGNLFGVNNQSSWPHYFLFNPAQNFINISIASILSIFLHSSFRHFLVNLSSFIIIGGIFEKWQGRNKTLIVFFLSHLLTLISIYLHYEFKGLEKDVFYSGGSAGVLGLLSAYAFLKEKKITYLGLLCILGFQAYQEKPLLIDPHLTATFFGICIAFCLRRLSIQK